MKRKCLNIERRVVLLATGLRCCMQVTKTSSFSAVQMASLEGGALVVIDAKAHMLGRLASLVAKQLLNGQKVVVVRCEDLVLSGGFVRQKG
mgnify:CR=1 FL=1